jgi:transcriptional regulator with XRE-family HTH domain
MQGAPNHPAASRHPSTEGNNKIYRRYENMNMSINSINENIKKLRREKNITQEKLAEHLNISIQAVSKWERSETLPDITMIIPIASYFGVTTDELLGVDAAKTEARVQEYLKENDNLAVQCKWDKRLELMTKAHKEFPNDFRIIFGYMRLFIERTDNPVDVLLSRGDEFTGLCERILDECTIDYIRAESIHILAQIKRAQGKIDEAFELLDYFPTWYCTKNQYSEQLFDKKTDEWWHWIKKNFKELADFALNKLRKIIWYSDKPFNERVEATQKIIGYLLKILDETNYEPLYRMIAATYSEMGCWYHRESKSEEVIKCFDTALDYHKKISDFDMLKTMLNWYENNPWFAELRKLDSFSAMLEKYRPFAK